MYENCYGCILLFNVFWFGFDGFLFRVCCFDTVMALSVALRRFLGLFPPGNTSDFAYMSFAPSKQYKVLSEVVLSSHAEGQPEADLLYVAFCS